MCSLSLTKYGHNGDIWLKQKHQYIGNWELVHIVEKNLRWVSLTLTIYLSSNVNVLLKIKKKLRYNPNRMKNFIVSMIIFTLSFILDYLLTQVVHLLLQQFNLKTKQKSLIWDHRSRMNYRNHPETKDFNTFFKSVHIKAPGDTGYKPSRNLVTME